MPPSNKAIARKKLVIFYVLDTSEVWSMREKSVH